MNSGSSKSQSLKYQGLHHQPLQRWSYSKITICGRQLVPILEDLNTYIYTCKETIIIICQLYSFLMFRKKRKQLFCIRSHPSHHSKSSSGSCCSYLSNDCDFLYLDRNLYFSKHCPDFKEKRNRSNFTKFNSTILFVKMHCN